MCHICWLTGMTSQEAKEKMFMFVEIILTEFKKININSFKNYFIDLVKDFQLLYFELIYNSFLNLQMTLLLLQ